MQCTTRAPCSYPPIHSYTVRIRRNNEDDLTFSLTKRCNGTDDGKAPLENRTVDTEANTILRVDSSRAAYFEFAEKKCRHEFCDVSDVKKREKRKQPINAFHLHNLLLLFCLHTSVHCWSPAATHAYSSPSPPPSLLLLQ
jgi:hypothetical protein